jgi:hypothetical protein
MTDNSTGFNNLQERNQQVLDNISQLQIQEKDLYKSLDDVSLSSQEKTQIINKINEISQIRMNLYSGLKDMYSYYQQNVTASRSTLGQSMVAIDVLENELNDSKLKMNLIEDQKNNKLRLVEINTYFGKRYNAHSNLMKTIVFMCIPVIFLAFLFNRGILPSNIFKLLSVIIFVIGIVLIGLQLIDMSNRDEMNWDEYNWYFDTKNAPNNTTQQTESESNPWTTPSVMCVGSACCYDGSSYDSIKNICVPNTIQQNINGSGADSNTATDLDTGADSNTETFKGLEKYGYSQLKSMSLYNDNVSPLFASLSKF